MDKKPVLVSIFRGSGLCSVNCQKVERAEFEASLAERQRRRDEDYARRCRGGSVTGRMCRRVAPDSATLPWACHDHRNTLPYVAGRNQA